MKFTLSWLREHLETEASAGEIAAALTDLGLEVEGVTDPAERLGAFLVGEVLEAGRHPDAERLSLCRVETGSGVKQVVCGAPNVRTGMKGVVALPGAYIPGTGITLGVGKIRGVESEAMLLSERELELSDEHEGIIELPEDAPVGMRYVDYAGLNDPVIEIKITPNRPDALGVAGIARDLAARGLGRSKTGWAAPVPGRFLSPVGVELSESVREKACPLFVGRYFKGVKNGPSPEWLQRRLKAIGLRPISALVDITNYLTFDRARPLHVFDADELAGGIHVRKAWPGESLIALDGRIYEFDGTETLICDEAGPQAIGGIIGGEATGCTERTRNVFVEAAYFDPIQTAATGRRLRIHSDARYRFERGIDPAFTPEGMEIATRLILDLCGGEASELVFAGRLPNTERRYILDTTRTQSLVGMEIAPEEQMRILTDLGFGVAREHQAIEVWVPSWRPDVQGEADLVEEIARVASLTKLQSRPMKRPSPGVARPTMTPMQRREALARRTLASLGLNECVTYSFIAEREAVLFGGGGEAVRLENPISSEMSHLRPSLMPGLLAAAARNQARGFLDLGLFEIGFSFQGGEPGEERLEVAGLRIGASAPRNPFGTRRPVDVFDAKADAEAVLAALGAPVERLAVSRAGLPDWLHPGRAAYLALGPKNPLALMGEIHPRVLEAAGVRG
ncbi:MAG TPA: phenylalanine--tRNA ligase subunit beta, partial [Paracoccaceae bacterium]|nr:phenylalanine--tRNA ligase subunit beta [Paracoccaceae bacterium]